MKIYPTYIAMSGIKEIEIGNNKGIKFERPVLHPELQTQVEAELRVNLWELFSGETRPCCCRLCNITCPHPYDNEGVVIDDDGKEISCEAQEIKCTMRES